MCRIFASRYSSHSLTTRNVQVAGGGRGLIPKHPVIHGPSRDHFGTYSDTVEFMAEAMNVSRYMVWDGCYHLRLVVYVEKGVMPLAQKREPSSCFVKYRPVWGVSAKLEDQKS